MRTTTKATLASVLVIALLAVGCGTAQKATHEQTNTDSATKQGAGGNTSTTTPSAPASNSNTGGATSAPPPTSQWELLGKWSDVQGTIVSVQKTGDVLQSLSILVEKDFKTPTNPDTTPDFPLKVGSTVNIAFSSQLPTGGAINPKVGEEVVLGVGQFDNTKDQQQPPFWGSSFDRYWYDKDHKFYNQKGEAYKIYTGTDLQQTEVYTQ